MLLDEFEQHPEEYKIWSSACQEANMVAEQLILLIDEQNELEKIPAAHDAWLATCQKAYAVYCQLIHLLDKSGKAWEQLSKAAD